MEGVEFSRILLTCCFSKLTEAETPADRLRIAILGERGRRGWVEEGFDETNVRGGAGEEREGGGGEESWGIGFEFAVFLLRDVELEDSFCDDKEEDDDERKETVFWVSKSIVPELTLLATKQVSSCTKISAFISCSGFKTVSFFDHHQSINQSVNQSKSDVSKEEEKKEKGKEKEKEYRCHERQDRDKKCQEKDRVVWRSSY